MQKIQIKRGNKKNLPILNPGEPAFTLDTKELFVGDGVMNNKIMATNKNLIINSNFQVSLDTFDNGTNTITLLPGESKYIYGNYFIQNLSSSIGSVVISRTFTDGMITIVGINSSISLEYRERLPRYTSTTGQITYIKPLNGKVLTLSYDVTNTTSPLSNIKAGVENNLVSYSLNMETIRKAITFTMSYSDSGAYPLHKIILFALNTNRSFSIMIGNIKLEESTVATLYSPSPLYYDVAMLNRTYFSCNAITRSIQVTTNAVKFSIPVTIPQYYNYSVKFFNESLILSSINGATQFGYTVTNTYLEKTTSVEINCTKLNHGMTDAYILARQFLDLRPY